MLLPPMGLTRPPRALEVQKRKKHLQGQFLQWQPGHYYQSATADVVALRKTSELFQAIQPSELKSATDEALYEHAQRLADHYNRDISPCFLPVTSQ